MRTTLTRSVEGSCTTFFSGFGLFVTADSIYVIETQCLVILRCNFKTLNRLGSAPVSTEDICFISQITEQLLFKQYWLYLGVGPDYRPF